jgi:TIR domain
MKVFISYSKYDRSTAESLYRDLRAAGAEPFEFGTSAQGDSAIFSEIIGWIGRSDAFLALISATALESFAVGEEIRHANHRYINSRGTHPAKIISLLIEAGREPPEDIERFSQIDFTDYSAGRPTLFRRLGLELPAARPALTPVLPEFDLDKLALDYAKSRPAEEDSWFEKASRLITNYKDLKPVDLPKDKEAEHVDSLLAEMSGQPTGEFVVPDDVAPVESAFLGVAPSERTHLSDQLVRYDLSKAGVALDAPVVSTVGDTLLWSSVPNATGYVVELSYGLETLGNEEVYRGTDLSYEIPAISRMYVAAEFRVKATGGVFRPDSPWSDPIRFEATTTLVPPRLFSPAPPTLELTSGPLTTLEWSEVDDATGYVLERTPRPHIRIEDIWQAVYEGEDSTYFDFARMGKPKLEYAYRVKALGPWGDTAWSDEVVG